jgi:hypothetical protein
MFLPKKGISSSALTLLSFLSVYVLCLPYEPLSKNDMTQAYLDLPDPRSNLASCTSLNPGFFLFSIHAILTSLTSRNACSVPTLLLHLLGAGTDVSGFHCLSLSSRAIDNTLSICGSFRKRPWKRNLDKNLAIFSRISNVEFALTKAYCRPLNL